MESAWEASSTGYLFPKSHSCDSYQGLCTHQASLTSVTSPFILQSPVLEIRGEGTCPGSHSRSPTGQGEVLEKTDSSPN